MTKIILASSSPRRKELLKNITDDFIIIPSSIEEKYPSTLDLTKVSLFLSDIKALDVYSKNTDSLVIGCDTTVIVNNTILGKPKDYNDAKKMLKMLSNKMHLVVTGVSVYYKNHKYQINSINKIYFKKLSNTDIENYLSNDEYIDKAGAYAIQGLANKFIDKFEGEFEAIVGLPIKELESLLKELIH